MSITYNVVNKDKLTLEEEIELAKHWEEEGNNLPYLTDEDFAKLSNAEQEKRIRLEQLNTLQKHYKRFIPFLTDIMYELGFSTTKIQADIGKYLEEGPKYRMIQAQRSQAKTTIAAAYCVWRLVHNPRERILIISAGGSQAADISTLIIRIIMNVDVLECLRPDKSAGDRVSVEKFDVHYSLRKLDKSASVSCCGITANLQGRRADVLLADDIESQKNSLTALMREQLHQKTLDFTSINATGDIIYLGTPQSSDSIYKTLPERGYDVRIWPGRFPTVEQLPYYNGQVAPVLVELMERFPQLRSGGGVHGDQGIPIEPTFLGEEVLRAKEKDQGPAWFQLQHMLNTELMDAERHPLKTENIPILPIRVGDELPLEIKRGYTYEDISVNGKSYRYTKPHFISSELSKPQGVCLYFDPAGGGKGKGTHGGDETGWACTAFLNGNIYVLGVGGIKGGYDNQQLEEMAALVGKFKPNVVKIEINFGYGALRSILLPIIRERYPDCAVEDDFVTGQKEVRIIDILEPIIARGSLIFAESVVKEEAASLNIHPDVSKMHYSLSHQLTGITRDKDSLIHDDRLDALAGSCNHWEQQLILDQKKVRQRLYESIERKFWNDPLQHNRYSTRNITVNGKNMLAYRRGRR